MLLGISLKMNEEIKDIVTKEIKDIILYVNKQELE